MNPRKSISSSKIPLKKGSSQGESSSSMTIILMFIGLFLGLSTFVFIGMATMVSKIFLSKILAFFCFVGLLLPFRFYLKWFGMSKVEAMLFNIMAIGPTICSVLLWLNFLVRMGEHEEIFTVAEAKFSAAEHFDNIDVIFTLQNDTVYAEYQEFRTVPLEKGDLEKAKAKHLKIKTADGLLGYKVFLGNEVVQE